MSAEHPTDQKLSNEENKLLMMMRDRSDSVIGGFFSWRLPNLAAHCGWSDEMAMRGIKSLEQKGFLKISRDKHDAYHGRFAVLIENDNGEEEDIYILSEDRP